MTAAPPCPPWTGRFEHCIRLELQLVGAAPFEPGPPRDFVHPQLTFAVQDESTGAVDVLLSKGANPNITDHNEVRPLTVALGRGRDELRERSTGRRLACGEGVGGMRGAGVHVRQDRVRDSGPGGGRMTVGRGDDRTAVAREGL